MDDRDLLTSAGLPVPDDEIEGVVTWIGAARAIAASLREDAELPALPLLDGVDWQEFCS